MGLFTPQPSPRGGALEITEMVIMETKQVLVCCKILILRFLIPTTNIAFSFIIIMTSTYLLGSLWRLLDCMEGNQQWILYSVVLLEGVGAETALRCHGT